MSNVVSLFDKKKEKEEKTETTEKVEVKETFEEAMKRNEATKQRMEKDRLNANKSVLRSYRIKH
jgi:hypothetical protein